MKTKKLLMLPLVALMAVGLAACDPGVEDPVAPIVSLTIADSGHLGEVVEFAYTVDQENCEVRITAEDPDGALIPLNEQVSSFTPMVVGVYYLKLEATNAAGLKGSVQDNITISLKEPPLVAVAPVVTITLQEVAEFGENIPVAYEVDQGGCQIKTELIQPDGVVVDASAIGAFVSDQSGIYKYRVTATNEDGLIGRSTKSVLVNEPPVAPILKLTLAESAMISQKVEFSYTIDQLDCEITVTLVKPDLEEVVLSENSFMPEALGIHKINISAKNEHDLVGSVSGAIEIVDDPDLIAPVVELTVPATAYNGDTVEYSYTTDREGYTIEVSLKDPSGETTILSESSFVVSTGTYTLAVKAVNARELETVVSKDIVVSPTIAEQWALATASAGTALEVSVSLPQPAVTGLTGFDDIGDLYGDGSYCVSPIGPAFSQANLNALNAWLADLVANQGFEEGYDVNGYELVFAPDDSYNIGIFTNSTYGIFLICFSTTVRHVPADPAVLDASWEAALASVNAVLEIEATATLMPRIDYILLESFTAQDVYLDGSMCIVFDGMKANSSTLALVNAWAAALPGFENAYDTNGYKVYFAPDDAFNFGVGYLGTSSNPGDMLIYFDVSARSTEDPLDTAWSSALSAASNYLQVSITDVPRYGAGGTNVTGYSLATASETMFVALIQEGAFTQSEYQAWGTALLNGNFSVGSFGGRENVFVHSSNTYAVTLLNFGTSGNGVAFFTA